MSTLATGLAPARSGERAKVNFGGMATLVYGLGAYASFLVTITYAIGFVGNWFVPKSIDSGAAGAVVPSMLINAALLLVFVVQHTIMARPAFKRWWVRYIPQPMERSTFVWLASGSLGLIFWQWRPLPGVIWRVDGVAGAALTGLSLAGWAMVFIAAFTISHFDLFGVRQAWLRFRNRIYTPVGFSLIGLYRLVRHPLMLGFLIAFWATPTMTVGHLFFAAMITGYIRFGLWMEERDLIAEHGEDYLSYQRRVPGLNPLGRRAM